jgi:hypothetical protein
MIMDWTASLRALGFSGCSSFPLHWLVLCMESMLLCNLDAQIYPCRFRATLDVCHGPLFVRAM